MVVGTTTSVKHNPKEDLAEGVPRNFPKGKTEDQSSIVDDKEVPVMVGGTEERKSTRGTHQSHEYCKNCGSLADKCSCKECECQVCSSKSGSGEMKVLEPPIKSGTSSAVVCGGECIAAAQRASAGGCPACDCLAKACPMCDCPICGPHHQASLSPPSCGGDEARKRLNAGNCPACSCPATKCPCTGCKCPVCNPK